MSQHDCNITTEDANTGTGMRAAINAALQALAGNNCGPAEPTTTYPFMWWYDTTNGVLKMRNAGNTAWVTLTGLLVATLLMGGTAPASDSSGTIALNLSAAGGFYVTLSGTGRTVTVSNPIEGGVWRLAITQGTGGSKTITTWPTMTWLGGGAPTLSTTAEKTDFVTFTYINGVLYGSFTQA